MQPKTLHFADCQADNGEKHIPCAEYIENPTHFPLAIMGRIRSRKVRTDILWAFYGRW